MSFIYGGNTGKTAAQVKREREIAEALMGRTLSRTPRNVGEGLSAIGNALAYRGMVSRADKADKEGRAGADAAFAPIMAALGGRQGQQASPADIESSPLSAPGNLPPEVINAVMMTESGGDPNAVSPKGAEGLMQVMPATGADPGYGVTPLDPNKPGDNLRFGTDYLNAMHRAHGGDLDKTLAAYNAGPGAVAKYGGVPPYPETRAYIEKVKGRLPTQTSIESPSAPQSAPQSLLPLLMKAASNDYLNPGQQAVVSALLQRELGGKDMPAAVKQYQFAQQQGYGGSFMDYLAATKAGTTVNNNVGARQETEYGKARGKAYADRAAEFEESGLSAGRALTSLDVMEQAMSDPAFYSGAGGENVLAMKRFGAALGFSNPDGIDSMEAFNAQAKQAALDVMGGSLGTGFSNADRDFVTSQVPGLEATPEGNRIMIAVQRKIQERKIQIAQMAREYEAANGQLNAGFMRQLDGFAKANPVFDPGFMDALRAANDAGGAPDGVDPDLWKHLTPEERQLWAN